MARLSLISAPLPFFIISDFKNTGFKLLIPSECSHATWLGKRHYDVKKEKKSPETGRL